MFDDRDVGVHVSSVPVTWSGDSDQGFLGLLNVTVSDEPPGRFGGEESGSKQGDRPGPLNNIGHPPTGKRADPSFIHGECSSIDTSSDETAHSPAHGDEGRGVTSELDRADLSGISGSQGV